VKYLIKLASMKPLGHKSYGSIPHLTGSRTGPADRYCEPGQQRILTERARDKNDLIIVQEKTDGSNCAAAKIGGQILALTRSGYMASTSPYKQHHLFEDFVRKNRSRFDKALQEGERLVGEWLIQAHGTRYDLKHEPFIAFDIMKGHERMTYHNFLLRILPQGFTPPALIHIGQPFKLENAKLAIKEGPGGHGAIDPVEGVVYRCEREGKVDFLCKWVRPDKQDGKYLPEISGASAVWNLTEHEIRMMIIG